MREKIHKIEVVLEENKLDKDEDRDKLRRQWEDIVWLIEVVNEQVEVKI